MGVCPGPRSVAATVSAPASCSYAPWRWSRLRRARPTATQRSRWQPGLGGIFHAASGWSSPGPARSYLGFSRTSSIAGPLAGAVLFAGAGGSLLFGLLGFIVAIPLLLRLRRHSGGWRVPLAALALFAAAFSISTFVIGPQISGGDEGSATPVPASSTGTPAQGSSHASHH